MGEFTWTQVEGKTNQVIMCFLMDPFQGAIEKTHTGVYDSNYILGATALGSQQEEDKPWLVEGLAEA